MVQLNFIVERKVDSDSGGILYDEPLGVTELVSWICLHPTLKAISIEDTCHSEHSVEEITQFLDFLEAQLYFTSVHLGTSIAETRYEVDTD